MDAAVDLDQHMPLCVLNDAAFCGMLLAVGCEVAM